MLLQVICYYKHGPCSVASHILESGARGVCLYIGGVRPELGVRVGYPAINRPKIPTNVRDKMKSFKKLRHGRVTQSRIDDWVFQLLLM